MGIRSDVCIILEFNETSKDIVKDFFVSTILEKIDSNENFKFLINNFYRTINNHDIQFVFFEEAIKASYLEHEELFNLIDEFNNIYKKKEDDNTIIFYEYKEVCAEFLEDGGESLTNKGINDDKDIELYTNISLGGIPEINDDLNQTLVNWLSTT